MYRRADSMHGHDRRLPHRRLPRVARPRRRVAVATFGGVLDLKCTRNDGNVATKPPASSRTTIPATPVSTQ